MNTLFFIFFILDILVSVKWYPIVVFIYIPLIANDIEASFLLHGHLYILFVEMFIQILWPYKK